MIFLPLIIIGSSWHTLEPCIKQSTPIIIMECQSNGYYTDPFDITNGIHIEVDVLAYAQRGDGRYWASLALNSNIRADDRYASVGITKGIAPYWNDDRTYGIHLSTPASECCDRLLAINTLAWHHLTLDYRSGIAKYGIDDINTQVMIDLGQSAVVELLCVAVDPGETKPNNIAHCEFANVDTTQN